MKGRIALLATAALLLILLRPSPRPAAAPRNAPAPETPPAATAFPATAEPQDVERSRVAPPATSELLIFLKPGVDARLFARDLGLTLRSTLRSVSTAHVFAAHGPAAAEAALTRAREDVRVARAGLNRPTQHVHCAFIVNDQYFPDGSSSGLRGQWHLDNGASANHANVAAAWAKDVTGSGVVVGIVDDGLERLHPDLSPNYAAADSWNFGNGTNDPSPNPAYDGTANEDRHGTSVAGVAAARGGNGIGTTGAAPLASLAGLRVDFLTQTTAMFVDATLHRSTPLTGGTSIKIKNHSYGVSAPYIAAPEETDAVTESAGAGTIHLFAAGNERGTTAQDSNKTEPQNNPNAIAVAALGSDGKYSWYSSFGANVFVTAPSSGVTGFGITTTDRTGQRGYNAAADSDTHEHVDYTSTFGGTSSATPLAAGILALGKQVRPAMDVRMAKHALVHSSKRIDVTDGTATGGGNGTAGSAWKTNGAGLPFNQNYGFGLIDADKFVEQLQLMDGVTPAAAPEMKGPFTVGATIPDNNPTGVSRTFTIAATARLEEILVTLSVSHNSRGQIEAYLTSPSNTTRRLFYRSSDNGNNINWTFVSNEFWGEVPTGTWTLRVADVTSGMTGTWNSYAVEARTGTMVESAPPTVVSITRASANPTAAASVSYTVTFSEHVSGIDAADFALTTTGNLTGASVTAVTGNRSTCTVTVNTGTGDGTLRLDLADNDTILDFANNKLGGTGVGNGSFTSGEVYIVDRLIPTVLNVNSPDPDGIYRLGNLSIRVTFSEDIVVTGLPQLRLATGGAGSLVSYSSGSGSAVLTFGYTVTSGHNSPDLDCFSTGALTLNGGSIKDAAGNNAILTLAAPGTAGSLGANKNLVIDTAPPAAPGTPSGAPNPNTGAFLVSWTAASDGAGSGIASYTVLRSDNGGAFATLATGLGSTSMAQNLAPGSYRYQVFAIDVAGNTGALSATSAPVVVDTTPPAAPSTPDLAAASDAGTSSTDNLTNLTTLTFTGSAESGAGVQLFVDGVPGATTTAAGGTWTLVASSLSAGVRSITAQATDAAGNVGPLSGALAVTIDLGAPAAPSTPNLAAASDSGTSSSDDLTNLTTLSFSGTAEAGATVRLFVDGSPGATTIATGGNWTLVAPSVAPGVRSITAQATDPAGNAGTASGGLAVTVDTGAPGAPSVPDLDAGSDTGNPADNITTLSSLSFSGSAEAGATVQLFVDGAAGATTTATGGVWTLVAPAVADGVRSITARATDAAGNVGTPSSALSVTVDSTAPAVPSVPDLHPASDTGASGTDNITTMTTLTFTGTAEAGVTVQLFVDGVAGATTIAAGGNWTLAATVAPGVRSITARASDAGGNTSAASGALSVTVDASVPSTPSIPDLDAASDTGTSAVDNLTKLTSLSFSGSAEAGSTVELFADGVSAGSTVAIGGAWTIVSSPLSPGVRTITARALDPAGNLSPASGGLDVTIDVTAPAIPAAPVLEAASDTGVSAADRITTVTTPTFTGVAEAGATVRLLAGATLVGTAVAAPGGAYTVASSPLADGSIAFTVTATDVAGNVSAASAATLVVIDNSAPVAGQVDDGAGTDIAVQSSATTIVAHWSGFDDPLSGILKYEVAIGTTPGGVQIEGFTDVGTATAATRGPFVLLDGTTYYVTVRATNPVDLSITATSNGVTVDLTPPSPPGSIQAVPGHQSATIVWTASPSADAAFYRLWWKPAASAWGSATLIDNLPGLSTTVGGLVNGVLTDFRLRAVDAAGNESSDRFVSTTPFASVQIVGGGSYATIQEGIDAAAPGQIVQVGPGTYVGDIVLQPGVSLQGFSPDATVLQGSGAGPVITVLGTFGSGLSSTISQLTVTGGLSGVDSASADVTIRNVVIHHVGGDGVSVGAAGALTAVNVTLMSNAGDGLQSLGQTVVRNAIAGQNGGFGFNVPGAASVTYSNAYGNTGGDFSVGSGATGNFSTPAGFTDAAGFDYTTPASSPTVDVGDPADDYSLEPLPNGGRIDLGAYGNTGFAPLSTTPSAPSGGGKRKGGGCGLLGLEGWGLLAVVGLIGRCRRQARR